jgi:hypothetical protein
METRKYNVKQTPVFSLIAAVPINVVLAINNVF